MVFSVFKVTGSHTQHCSSHFTWDLPKMFGGCSLLFGCSLAACCERRHLHYQYRVVSPWRHRWLLKMQSRQNGPSSAMIACRRNRCESLCSDLGTSCRVFKLEREQDGSCSLVCQHNTITTVLVGLVLTVFCPNERQWSCGIQWSKLKFRKQFHLNQDIEERQRPNSKGWQQHSSCQSLRRTMHMLG